MSWQMYVDNNLLQKIQGKRHTSAAILGKDGSVWGKSSNFPEIKPGEISAINNGFARPETLASSGIYIGGINYTMTPSAVPNVIYGKKGRSGVTIKKTNKTLIVGIYDEPMPHNLSGVVVEGFGDYLIEQGY